MTEDEIITILRRALNDEEQGFGKLKIEITTEALLHLAKYSDGDESRALSALEIAVLTTEPDRAGIIKIDTKTAEESIQKKHIVYDKAGDEHYNTTSAFIKSMRVVILTKMFTDLQRCSMLERILVLLFVE